MALKRSYTYLAPRPLFRCFSLFPSRRRHQDIVSSDDLETTFDMIGGLGELKDEVMDIVSRGRIDNQEQ